MRILMAVVVAVVGALSQRAEACSCKQSLVVSGAEVPVNARLPVLDPFSTDTTFTLTTEAGVAVPAEAVLVPGGFLVVPTQPLAPDAGYLLTHGGESESFRTGPADSLAPAAPTLGSFTHSLSPVIGRSTCDLGGEGFLVSLTSPAEGVAFQIFTGPHPESIDTASPAMVLPIDPSASFFLGDNALCSARFPASKQPNLAIQIRTVDLAGNVSELSNPLQLKSSGCSATGGSALVLAVLLLARKSLKRGRKSQLS